MTAAAKPAIESFTFGGESVGPVAATALRRIRTLAEAAPPGRLFASISTLADISATAAREYELAGIAELERETEQANSHLARATRLMRNLNGTVAAEMATPLPAFVRRK
jgi:uncharacterized glyoxalase superfamily metalloenzyme YdcJ